jgi:ribonucleoside-diphosphate reductase alpha chain
MQAALQPFVDQAVSKTLQVPAGSAFDDFARVFERADALGLKGCTAFRVNPVRAGVLLAEGPPPTVPACRGDGGR